MIVTTVAASALALTGGAAVVLRDSHRSRAFPRKRFSATEVQSATSLGYATCRFEGARRTRKLHLVHIGDVLIFRSSEDPTAELTELVHLRNMKASLVGKTTIDIEAGVQKVSLQVDSKPDADKLLLKLKEAADFSDTAAKRMASVIRYHEEMSEGNSSVFRIKEGSLCEEAKDYLVEHRLAERLSWTLEALIEERPRDPASFIAEKLRKSEVLPCPTQNYRKTRGDEAEVDSPRLALMRLAMNWSTGQLAPTVACDSPTWRNQSPAKSSDLSSPSRKDDQVTRSPNFSSGWNAAG